MKKLLFMLCAILVGLSAKALPTDSLLTQVALIDLLPGVQGLKFTGNVNPTTNKPEGKGRIDFEAKESSSILLGTFSGDTIYNVKMIGLTIQEAPYTLSTKSAVLIYEDSVLSEIEFPDVCKFYPQKENEAVKQMNLSGVRIMLNYLNDDATTLKFMRFLLSDGTITVVTPLNYRFSGSWFIENYGIEFKGYDSEGIKQYFKINEDKAKSLENSGSYRTGEFKTTRVSASKSALNIVFKEVPKVVGCYIRKVDGDKSVMVFSDFPPAGYPESVAIAGAIAEILGISGDEELPYETTMDRTMYYPGGVIKKGEKIKFGRIKRSDDRSSIMVIGHNGNKLECEYVERIDGKLWFAGRIWDKDGKKISTIDITNAWNEEIKQEKNRKYEQKYNELCRKFGKKYVDAAMNGRVIVGMPIGCLKHFFLLENKYASVDYSQYKVYNRAFQYIGYVGVGNGKVLSISY